MCRNVYSRKVEFVIPTRNSLLAFVEQLVSSPFCTSPFSFKPTI